MLSTQLLGIYPSSDNDDNEGNGDEFEEVDINEDGNGGEGSEEGDKEGNEEGSDEGGIGYEGGNNELEEGNESIDDIYEDIDIAAKNWQ